MKPIFLFRPLCGLLVIAFVMLIGCTEMNDVHSVYLQRGETIYVGKPDSAEARPGNGRMQLRFWSSDMKAVKMVVYWRSGTDSVIVDIPKHLPTESLDLVIPNLAESNYTFELVTMNQDLRNRSVPFQVSGTVYGELFQSALLDRFITSSTLSPEQQLEIKWRGAIEKGIGCEVQYVDANGVTATVFVPMAEPITQIDQVQSPVYYRTLFLPEQNAIDTFYTEYKPVPL